MDLEETKLNEETIDFNLPQSPTGTPKSSNASQLGLEFALDGSKCHTPKKLKRSIQNVSDPKNLLKKTKPKAETTLLKFPETHQKKPQISSTCCPTTLSSENSNKAKTTEVGKASKVFSENQIRLLRRFDLDLRYGPFVGITRLTRYKRAKELNLNPPEEVSELLNSPSLPMQQRESYITKMLHPDWVL